MDPEGLLGTMLITDTTQARFFIKAHFSATEKVPTLPEVAEAIQRGDYVTYDCKVNAIISMNHPEYIHFGGHFTVDTNWIEPFTGLISDDPSLPETFKWWELTDEQQATFKRTCYRVGAIVTCRGRQPFFVSSGGYKYARHVGLILPYRDQFEL